MARELRTSTTSGQTIYAIIRRISDSYVWTGTAFAAWADGSIANYDVALTDRGGDEYSADWPSSMAAGNYRVYYYIRAGATPAITDTMIDSPVEKYWDGSTAASASDVVLSSTALTSLEALKRHVRETTSDNDTLLTECINRASALIERVTGRLFKGREYTERYNGDHQRRLQLRQYPLVYVSRVAYGAANAFGAKFTGTAIRANASLAPDRLRLTTVTAAGTTTGTSLLFSDYPTCSTMETAVEAVSGWTATVYSDQPMKDLQPTAGEDALNLECLFEYPDRDNIDYTVDYDTAQVEIRTDVYQRWGQRWGGPVQVYRDLRQGFAHRFQSYCVTYYAGYDTIPADVENVCNEIATEMFWSGIDNPTIKSTTLGPFSTTFSDSDWTTTIRQRLSHYMSDRAIIAAV